MNTKLLSNEDKKVFENFVDVGNVRGMKIVCNKEHSKIFEKKKNDCIKRLVCEKCSRFIELRSNEKVWYCCKESYDDWLKKRTEKSANGTSFPSDCEKVYTGMEIPYFCNKCLEHRVFSQEEI